MSGSNDDSMIVSPFLNFDPSLLVSDPNEQFIFPEGEKQRGHFERAFSEIGAMAIGGAIAGGTRGLLTGLRDPELPKLGTTALKRSQILNHITKSGGSLAQTCGVIALLYGIIDFGLYKSRGSEDELNTLVATTSTGLLYKSVSIRQVGGLKKCLRGGLVGLVVGLGMASFSGLDRIKQMIGSNT